jgi:tetratricopeptide (TPR) repeat protein
VGGPPFLTRNVWGAFFFVPLIGCGHTPPSAEPLHVDLSGCSRVRVRSECAPSPDAPLRVVVDESVELELRLDDSPLEAAEVLRGVGFTRVTVQVPTLHTTRVLTVRTRNAPMREARLMLLPPLTLASRTQQALEALDSNHLDRALQLATEPEPIGETVDDGRLLGVAGRVHLRRGQRGEALPLLARSARILMRRGELSLALFDELARVFALGNESRVQEALDVLDGLAPSLGGFREGRVRCAYHRGLVISRLGDLRAELDLLRTAREGAAVLGVEDVYQAASEVAARLLAEVGRFDEAERLMAPLEPDAASNECGRAWFDANLGWQRLLMAQTLDPLLAERPRPDARGPLERARDALARCGAEDVRSSVALQLGLDALLNGAPDLALEELRGVNEMNRELARWLPDIEGRALLARGDASEALARFDALLARARASDDASAIRRAQLGRGRALEARGDTTRAVEAYEDAERALDREMMGVPLEIGRATFAGDRFESSRRLVDLLVRLGRAPEALEAGRHSRARGLSQLAVRARIETLRDAERASFETALGAFARARRERESAAQSAWTLPEVERADAAVVDRSASEALDAALAILGDPGRVEPSELNPREAYLLLSGGIDHWIALAAHEGRVVAYRIARGPRVDVLRSALEQARLQWEGADALVLGLPGAFTALDAHALDVNGAPLVSYLPVRYALDVASRGPAPDRESSTSVVIDPRGDLPGARREGEAIRALAAAQFRVVQPATRAPFLEALSRSSALHFAGHGEASENGVASSLLLAEDERWMAGDTLSAARVPRIVFLSACEGAAELDSQQVVGLGVAESFVLAGAGRVIGSTRPISDADAVPLAVQIWGELLAGVPVDEAVRRASLSARSQGHTGWAALRVLSP